MTRPSTVTPTSGSQGLSYEWLLDITATPSATTPTWMNIPDITALDPKATPKQKDGTTYANKGATAQDKTGEDFTLSFRVKGIKDAQGEFQPALLALITAGDGIGAANVIGYRYYHHTSPTLAYKGTAGVTWNRVNNGNDDIEWFDITLTGKGDRAKFSPNPALATT